VAKGIAIVDSSGSYSESRARSLKYRLDRESPSKEEAPIGCTWDTLTCSPDEIGRRITEFWLVWAHDSPTGDDLELTLEAVIEQEGRHPNSSKIIIVCYGGGRFRKVFPPKNATREEQRVASRMIRTHKRNQEVLNFQTWPTREWNIEGFLRAVARTYPDVNESELLDVLCESIVAETVTPTSINHSALSIIQLLEGEMIEALRGCSTAKSRFSNKIPTTVRAINDLLFNAEKAVVKEHATDLFKLLREGLLSVKNLLQRLQGSEDWAEVNCDDAAKLLARLRTTCERLCSVLAG
jgi:hypothetical protein